MKNYNVITVGRSATPRSKRLREAGGYPSSGGTTVVSDEGNSTAVEAHTHDNKMALDAISIDNDNYLYLKQKPDGTDDSKTEKVKAGFADDAEHSKESDNADKWDGHHFDDYLDQEVKKGSVVEFLKLIISQFSTKGAIPGIETGTGALIDSQGNAEMQSLIIRSFLKVPQLIYNKVTVTGGEMWNTEGGTIALVEKDPGSDSAYILAMEVEDGDNIELDVDDICKGHYNSSGGFITSYFRVTSVDQAAKQVRIVLGANNEVPGGINAAPVPYMNVARYGNFTNEERQRSQYFSSSEQRISLLSGVDQYIIEPKHYKVVIGDVPASLVPDYLPITGKASIYLDNVIAKNFFQVDKSGEIIKTIRDRGLWSAAEAASNPYLCNSEYQDEVYHKSCKYRCISEGTTSEPRYDSPDWLLVAGDTSLSLDIESSNGGTFLYGQLDTILTAIVKRGVNDITSEILDSDFKWSRETGDIPADSVWNSDHSSAGKEVELKNEDLSATSGKFICTVYVRDGAETLSAEVSF